MKIINNVKNFFKKNIPQRNIKVAASNNFYMVKILNFYIKNTVLLKIQQLILVVLLISSVITITNLLNSNYINTKRSVNLEKTSQMLMHAQRLAKSASIILSDKTIFDELLESKIKVDDNFRELMQESKASQLDNSIKKHLDKILPFWISTEAATHNILKNKKLISEINKSYKYVLEESSAFIEASENINNFIRQNRINVDQDTVNLILIANRLLYNMNRLYTQQADADIVFAVNKDLINFQKIITIFKEKPDYTPIKEDVEKLDKLFIEYRESIRSILDVMPAFITIKKSQSIILMHSEILRKEISDLQKKFSMHLAPNLLNGVWPTIFGMLSFISLICLTFFAVKDYKARAFEAHKRQQEAETNQQIEQQKNSVNQKAIIRLMNELQEIANGNLTQQATVDANITGAIADFINYTVEELKGLVQRVKYTTSQVTQAFNNVQTTSMELLSNTNQQAKQINMSSTKIEEIAVRMHDMSEKTEQSMVIANDAIKVTEDGQIAAQRAIKGMQTIRIQIQDTSKHIKRLGESSIQISEITALIDNITQQTHILAINAAIQAANAGEAGKGFSVIAKEIQNLADKSGQATQQIGQLINTIQGDVSSAGSAMEYSIQGVVEGSHFTDAMDNALLKIQQTNQKLVLSMQEFARNMSAESTVANNISENIKQLLNVTEKTLQGTTHTSESMKTLSSVTKKLEQSVSRFIVD